MDPARAADQSWPDRNVQFRRPLTPPSTRKRQRVQPLAWDRNLETQRPDHHSSPDDAAQRAMTFAAHRAVRLGRLSSILDTIDHRDVAPRVASTAREVVR